MYLFSHSFHVEQPLKQKPRKIYIQYKPLPLGGGEIRKTK